MSLRRFAPLAVLLLVLGLATPVLPATSGTLASRSSASLPVPLPSGAVATALGTLSAGGTGQLSLGDLSAGDYNVLVEMPGGDPIGWRILDDSLQAVQVTQAGAAAGFALRPGEAVWQHLKLEKDGPLTLMLQGGRKAGQLALLAAAVPVPDITRARFTGLSPFAGHKSVVAVNVPESGLYNLDLRVGGNVLTIDAAGTHLNAVVADEQSADTIWLPAGLQEISLGQLGGGRPWSVRGSGPLVTAMPVFFDSQVRATMPASVSLNLGNKLGPVQASVTILAIGLADTQVTVDGGPVSLAFPIGNSGRTLKRQTVSIDPGATLHLDLHVKLADYVRQVCGPVCDQRLSTFILVLVDNAESYTPPVIPDLTEPPATNPATGMPNHGWFTDGVSFNLKGSADALARTEVSGDGVRWVPYDPSQKLSVSEDGIYNFYWRTAGLTGNGELPNLAVIKINKRPPVSDVQLTSPNPRNPDGSYNGPVTLAFDTATYPASLEPGTGLFSLDGYNQTAYDVADPVTIWTPGTYHLTMRAVDSSGLVEKPHQVSFTIAGTPPPGAGSYILATVGDVSAARAASLQKMLERAWEQDTNALGFTPATPILVEFISSRERWNWQLLADGNGLSTVSIVTGAGGISMFGGSHIEIPLDNDPATEPLDGALEDGDLQNTITHEMFHAILGKAGNDAAVPTWSNEGTAWQSGNLGQLPFSGGGQPFAAGSFLSARNTILNATKYGGFVPLDDIDVLASFWNTEAYSYLAIARLEQRLGTGKWISYLQAAVHGADDALQAQLGLSQQDINKDLRDWVNRQAQMTPGIGRVMLSLSPDLGPATLGFTAAGSGSGGVETSLLQPGPYTFYVQDDGTVWGPPGVTYTAAQHRRDFDRLSVTVTPQAPLSYQGKLLTSLTFYLRQSFGQWYLTRYTLAFDDGTGLAGPFIAGGDLAGLVRLQWVDTFDAATMQPRDSDVITLGITAAPPAAGLKSYLKLDSDRLVAGSDGYATLTGTAQPGAAVWVSGLGAATHADATGHFTLRVPVTGQRQVMVFASLSVPVAPATALVQLLPGAPT